MRMLVAATEDPKLMALAYAKKADMDRVAAEAARPVAAPFAPSSRPQPVITPARLKEGLKDVEAAGSRGKKQKEELLPENPKWTEITRALKIERALQKPDHVKDGHGGAWQKCKARLMKEYEVLTGAPYADGVVWKG
jgi:hypothetical protein